MSKLRIVWLILSVPVWFLRGVCRQYKHATRVWDECERAFNGEGGQ